jgi:hypothetical protein
MIPFDPSVATDPMIPFAPSVATVKLGPMSLDLDGRLVDDRGPLLNHRMQLRGVFQWGVGDRTTAPVPIMLDAPGRLSTMID